VQERTNKLALEKQWALEEAKRQTLERRKAEELQKAQEDLLQWQRGTTGEQAAPLFHLEESQHISERNSVESGKVFNSDKKDAEDAQSDDEDRFIPANEGRAAIVEIDEEEESGKSPEKIPSKQRHASTSEICQTVVKQASKPGVNLLLTGEAEERDSDAPLVARSSRRLQPVESDGNPDVQHEEELGKENMEQSEERSHTYVEEKKSIKAERVVESVPTPNLPPPRKRMVVPVQFTAKELRPNVPARESRLKEIELKKVNELCRVGCFLPEFETLGIASGGGGQVLSVSEKAESLE
jgi:hypothetical protein